MSISPEEAATIRREVAYDDSRRRLGDAASSADIHMVGLPSALRGKVAMAFADATSPDYVRREQGQDALRGLAFSLQTPGYTVDAAVTTSLAAIIDLAKAEAR